MLADNIPNGKRKKQHVADADKVENRRSAFATLRKGQKSWQAHDDADDKIQYLFHNKLNLAKGDVALVMQRYEISI